MIVHTETNLDFLPIPDELIVNLEDSKHLVLDMLENLPTMFEDSGVFDANLIQAIKAIGCEEPFESQHVHPHRQPLS